MDGKGINLHHLNLFYYIAKYKSITKAAEYLNLSQPAVSLQIKTFQKNCGVKLLDIIEKKIYLTPVGKSLYVKCDAFFNFKKDIEEIIYGNKIVKEIISIYTTLPFGEYYMKNILPYINTKLKNTYISVLQDTTDNIMDKILNFETDIGIVGKEIVHPKLITKRLLRDALFVICNPNHELASKKIIHPEELGKYTMITHEPNSSTRAIVANFAKENNIHLNIVEELYSTKLVADVIKQTNDISIISRQIILDDILSGKLKAIPIAGGLYRYFYLVYHKEKNISPYLGEIISAIESWCDDYNNSLIYNNSDSKEK